MISEILGIITPVLLIILIGYLVGLWQPLDLTSINKLNIDIFCPLLVYSTLSHSSLSIFTLGPLVIGAILIVIGSGLLAWLFCVASGYSIRAICPTAMFNNCGNMGLPLGFFAAGEVGLQIFVTLFVISNALHFTLGMKIVGAQLKWGKIFASPMMLATYAGLIANSLAIHFPAPIEVGLKMVGDVTIPLMLFALGVRMREVDWQTAKVGIGGGILCPVTGLIIAWCLAPYLALTEVQKQMLFLFAALPPAVLNFMLAERHQVEPKSVASIVLIGNIFAIIFVPIGLWLGLS